MTDDPIVPSAGQDNEEPPGTGRFRRKHREALARLARDVVERVPGSDVVPDDVVPFPGGCDVDGEPPLTGPAR